MKTILARTRRASALLVVAASLLLSLQAIAQQASLTLDKSDLALCWGNITSW